MLRLALYVAAVFALLFLLRHVPGVGWLFQIPLVGFFLAAAVLSVLIGWWTAYAVRSRTLRNQTRRLGNVDTPHNQGKLGSLLLKNGRARAALAPLARAAAGEPAHAEWHYRLAVARLKTGDVRGATEPLERAVAIDPDHAYGAPLLRLAEAQLALVAPAAALAAVERFERDRGATAESAWLRGRALRAAGQRDAAKQAFRTVGPLADQVLRGHRSALVPLRIKAWFYALG